MGRGEPSDRELEGKGITNDEALGGCGWAVEVRERRGGVGGAGVDDAGVMGAEVVFGG